MKYYWKNKGKIAKLMLKRLLIAGAALLAWNHFWNDGGIDALLNSGFFVAGAVFLYMTWRQYMNSEGIGSRFLKPGDYANAMVVDRNVRDPYDAQRQLVMDSADDLKFMANLFCALIFLIPCLISYLL